MSRPDFTTRPQWQALREHVAQIGQQHLRELLAADPRRGGRLAVEDVGLYLDCSKQLAKTTIAELTAPDVPTLGHDSSTKALIRRYCQLRDGHKSGPAT